MHAVRLIHIFQTEKIMNILAIETSCDETAAAVVADGTTILSNVIATSHEMHEKYGGIVPEVAARAQLEYINPVIREALQTFDADAPLLDTIQKNIDAIAVTVGPGLIGSLLVGVESAKTFAAITNKPLIPVNHVLAHMYANFILHNSVIPGLTRNPSYSPKTGSRLGDRDDIPIEFPAISLVVSGGHTELYLMKSPKELTWLGGTLDDAAGEAFDKTARLLGFGHKGGVAIQEAAATYTPPTGGPKVNLPKPMLGKENALNFSFSGLKTAIWREWNKQKHPTEHLVNAFAYSVQEIVTDVLVEKTLRAAQTYDVKSVLLSGGVSANLRLREKFLSKLKTLNSPLSLHVPPITLCTDNAVYIASYAYFRGKAEPWQTITALPDISVEVT